MGNTVSQQAKDFVQKLLVMDPSKRLTAAEAMEDRWVVGASQRNLSATQHVDKAMVDRLTQFGHASKFRRACMMMLAWSLTNDERAELREAFLEIDTEGTGVISLAELKEVIEAHFH